jgi:hypothetical protein
MRLHLVFVLVLFLPALASAAPLSTKPDLMWWTVQSRLGGQADPARDNPDTGTWIGTLRIGQNPTRINGPVPAGRLEADDRLSAWVRHSSRDTNATRLIPRKDGYTIPPKPAANSGPTLLGAVFRGREGLSAGSGASSSVQYPKAIIAARNPCLLPEPCTTLSLDLKEIPLEIVPIKTRPQQGFLEASSWNFVFEVRYRGRPLAQCPVTVHSADDRTLNMTTDEHGTFTVSSQEDRPATERWEHYLLSAVWLDAKQNIEHTATLKVVAPPPEFGPRRILRQAMYMGVALAMLVFAAVMAAIALTPDSEKKD